MKTELLWIVQKEIKDASRENSLKFLLGVIVVLLGFAIYAGNVAYKQQKELVEKAERESREDWLEQGDKHPHIAAHYGTYVFKPKTLLSLFDFGLDTYTGTSVYLEAHYQHEFMFTPAQAYGNLIRFGELSAAMVLQLLLPLLIIFMAFQAFTRERENGTLKLLLSQAISVRTIYLGKLLAYMLIILIIIVPFFLSLYILGRFQINASIISDFGLRILLLFTVYLVYLWIVTNFTIWVSFKSSSSRNALLALLTFWIVTGIIIPKTAANLGDDLYSLPSTKSFKERISRDISDGLKPGESKEERLERLKTDYLEKYHVDSLAQLPLNFEGIRMQEAEEYAAKVQAIHDEHLYAIFSDQNNVGAYLSFLAPILALRNLSMGFSSTDLNSFMDFQQKTNVYRLNLMRKMNYDMANNSRYGEFYEYKANKGLWKTLPDFKYQLPSVHAVFKAYRIELTSLSFWFLLSFLMFPTYKSRGL